jgi:hypothetical protein
MHKEDETRFEYAKPEVVDYGELRDLTAASVNGSTTDVPLNTTSPLHHVFTAP